MDDTLKEPKPWWPIHDGSSLLMSDVSSGTSTFIPGKVKVSRPRDTIWEKTRSVPFSKVPALLKRVETFQEELLHVYVTESLDDLHEPYRSNYHSFLVNLWSYSMEVKPEFRSMSIECIHRRSLTEGSEFAQWMDKYKAYILGVYNDREYFSNEIYSEFHPLPLNTEDDYVDLSGIFRANSLFEWQPPRANLLEICFEPVNIEPNSLAEFRSTAREYLSHEKFRFLKMPNWKTLVGPSDKKTADGPIWSSEECEPAVKRGRSVLVHIDRELKGARAAVKEEYSSLLRIRWIEQSIQRVLSLDSRDVSRNQAGILKAKLRDACKKDGYSYCRDFNKEGLTKPWEISKVLMEELYRASGWESFECTSFYDDWTYEEDGKTFYPVRGHGLGMGNALTTFMNIILEEMCSKRVGYRPNWSGYNNDDAATYHLDRKHAINYATEDRKICDELSLSFKPKASFIAKEEIVLCEQYWNRKNRNYGWKGSFYTEAFFGLLKCSNASEAKYRAGSTDVTYIPNNYMDIVISYWGWTLYRNEQSRTKLFGGWFSQKVKNVDLSFSKLKSSETVPREEYCAWRAYNKVKLEIRPWDKRKVANRLYNHFPEAFLEAFEVAREYEIGRNARTSHDAIETKRMWTSYQHALRAEFNKQTKLYDKLKEKPAYAEIYLHEVKAHPMIDYVPPIDRRTEEHCSETSVKDWTFFSPYSNLGADLELELWRMRPHQCNNISEGSMNLSLNRSGDGYKGAVKRAKELGLEGWETYVLPGPQARENFINPYAYIRVCDMQGSGYCSWIPTDVIEEKEAYLRERDGLYRRAPLKLCEWTEIGSVNISEIFLIRKIYELVKLTDEELKDLISFCKRFPGIGNTTLGLFTLKQIKHVLFRMASILEREPEWPHPKVFNEWNEMTYPYTYFSGQAEYPDVVCSEDGSIFSEGVHNFTEWNYEDQFDEPSTNVDEPSVQAAPAQESVEASESSGDSSEDEEESYQSEFDPSIVGSDDICFQYEYDWSDEL